MVPLCRPIGEDRVGAHIPGVLVVDHLCKNKVFLKIVNFTY